MQDNTIDTIDQVKAIMDKRYDNAVQDIRDGEVMLNGEVIDLDEPDIFDTAVLMVDIPVKRSGLICDANDDGISVSRMYSLMSCGPNRKIETVQDVEEILDMLENENPFNWL